MADDTDDNAAQPPYLISKVGDETFEIGLEPGWPLAVAFSFEDARVVATALNRDSFAGHSDGELCSAYEREEGKGPLADAYCHELERRYLTAQSVDIG